MASAESLNALFQNYDARLKQTERSDLHGLAGTHIASCARSLLDCASIGLAFDAIFSEMPIDPQKITSAMRYAWNQAVPDHPVDSFAGQSPELVTRSAPGWKHRLFDIETANRLNRGLWVGNLQLKTGQRATVAPLANGVPGALQITDEAGPVANAYQLKAIEQIRLFRNALERHASTLLLTLGHEGERYGPRHGPRKFEQRADRRHGAATLEPRVR